MSYPSFHCWHTFNLLNLEVCHTHHSIASPSIYSNHVFSLIDSVRVNASVSVSTYKCLLRESPCVCCTVVNKTSRKKQTKAKFRRHYLFLGYQQHTMQSRLDAHMGQWCVLSAEAVMLLQCLCIVYCVIGLCKYSSLSEVGKMRRVQVENIFWMRIGVEGVTYLFLEWIGSSFWANILEQSIINNAVV